MVLVMTYLALWVVPMQAEPQSNVYKLRVIVLLFLEGTSVEKQFVDQTSEKIKACLLRQKDCYNSKNKHDEFVTQLNVRIVVLSVCDEYVLHII